MSSIEPPVPVGDPVSEGGSVPESGSLIRSEERLDVTTRRAVAGRARLEKYQITETRTFTVDVVREAVRLVIDREGAEPVILDDPAASASDPAGGSETRWLVLSEEQVVITKQVVPVERVGLATVSVTEDRQVTESVRAERIELTQTAAPGRPGD